MLLKVIFLVQVVGPDESKVVTYKVMIWPIFIIYLIYSFKIIKTFNKNTKVFIYPLTEFTIIALIFYFLPTLGGGNAIWLMFFMIPILPILLVVNILFIIEAIEENMRKKQQDKQLQEDKKEQ